MLLYNHLMDEKGNVPYKHTCPVCGKKITGKVHFESLEKYMRGEMHIQHALPNMPAPERELFITGICNICWQHMFSENKAV